jgi:hypothetical protein
MAAFTAGSPRLTRSDSETTQLYKLNVFTRTVIDSRLILSISTCTSRACIVPHAAVSHRPMLIADGRLLHMSAHRLNKKNRCRILTFTSCRGGMPKVDVDADTARKAFSIGRTWVPRIDTIAFQEILFDKFDSSYWRGSRAMSQVSEFENREVLHDNTFTCTVHTSK